MFLFLKRSYVTFYLKKKLTISVTYIKQAKKGNNISILENLHELYEKVAGVKGLEPSTYRVTGDRSNQLSYTPTFDSWWAV